MLCPRSSSDKTWCCGCWGGCTDVMEGTEASNCIFWDCLAESRISIADCGLLLLRVIRGIAVVRVWFCCCLIAQCRAPLLAFAYKPSAAVQSGEVRLAAAARGLEITPVPEQKGQTPSFSDPRWPSAYACLSHASSSSANAITEVCDLASARRTGSPSACS